MNIPYGALNALRVEHSLVVAPAVGALEIGVAATGIRAMEKTFKALSGGDILTNEEMSRQATSPKRQMQVMAMGMNGPSFMA